MTTTRRNARGGEGANATDDAELERTNRCSPGDVGSRDLGTATAAVTGRSASPHRPTSTAATEHPASESCASTAAPSRLGVGDPRIGAFARDELWSRDGLCSGHGVPPFSSACSPGCTSGCLACVVPEVLPDARPEIPPPRMRRSGRRPDAALHCGIPLRYRSRVFAASRPHRTQHSP